MFALKINFFAKLCLILPIFGRSSADEVCNKFDCPGPLKYYDEIGCKGVYIKENDCCPKYYDCSHLGGRENDKCYANNNEYNFGDELKDEDKGPCDLGCTCKLNRNRTIADFVCAVAECFRALEPACYLDYSSDRCCGEPVCTDSEINCVNDGVNYKKGEFFKPSSDPDKWCICLPGYNGENIEPYCTKRKCGTEIYSYSNVRNYCAPVYYPTQKPISVSCSYARKCNQETDYVIKGENSLATESLPKCKLGELSLNIGDGLRNTESDYNSKCLRCICEVPPVLTCTYLSHEDCGYEQPPSAQRPEVISGPEVEINSQEMYGPDGEINPDYFIDTSEDWKKSGKKY